MRVWLVGMLLVAGCSTARADAFDCQRAAQDANARCKAQKPTPPKGSCCEPPPCLYRYQLTMYKMLQALFGDANLQSCAKDGHALEDLVIRVTQTPAFQNSLPNCKQHDTYEGHTLDMPPGFGTAEEGGKCVITASRGNQQIPVSTTSTASTWFSTCTELLDLSLAHEGVHVAACKAAIAAGIDYNGQNATAIGNEEVDGYHTSIGKMNDLFDHWNPECTPTKMKRDALRDAERGIKALKAATKGKCP